MDWGKIGVYLTVISLVVGVIWNYADTSISVRNLGDDVKELKHQSENLLRVSLETSARVLILERQDAQPTLAALPSTPMNLPPAPAGAKSHP